jgi:L-iditol 2-dehydrogenase
MDVVEITGVKLAGLADVPEPKAVGEFVKVKITAAPMCTEFKMYAKGQVSRVLGHEAAGEVVEVAQPGRVKVGQRVVVMPQYPCGRCTYCLTGQYIYCLHNRDCLAETGNSTGTATYAQYMLKQDWLLVPIPDDVSTEHASMACCGLGPTLGAMERMSVSAFDTVLITGMGPVGLGGVINGVHRGARVIAVEGGAYRAELAKELGAEMVLHPKDEKLLDRIMEFTAGRGIDKGIDCSGVPAAQQLLIRAVRRLGQVAFVGEGGDVTLNVGNDLLRKGLAVHGTWHYDFGLMDSMFHVIRKNSHLLDKQITHRLPMSRATEAFELQLQGQCGKVILDPWE